MRKRQGGQAFILVLILLAIGVTLIVPSLNLASTSLKNSQIAVNKTRALYAASAGQEWVLWSLTQPGFTNQLPEGEPVDFGIDVCGTQVDITIVMLALEGQGGLTLATDDVIRPTKTVECGDEEPPNEIPNDWSGTVTYTIRLEQLSGDNSQGLDAVYDILPKTLEVSDYETGSSYLSVDGGPWGSIPDPSFAVVGGQVRLVWPADYDWETGTGAFSSDPGSPNYFYGIRDFEVRQVKELKFEVSHTFSGDDKNSVLCNWVVLKPWDTLSGPQAPVTVGSPADPGVYKQEGLLALDKISVPEIIQPGEETDIVYTISITNLDGETHAIQEITDYLPPEFDYISGFVSGITTLEPQQSLENINGVDRLTLRWTQAEFPGGGAKSIASGETVTLTFKTHTRQEVSGSYYNEFTVIPDVHAPTIFSEIGVSDEEFYACYSWNTGTVMVPYYDSQVDADGTTIDSNLSIIDGGAGAIFTSWQVH